MVPRKRNPIHPHRHAIVMQSPAAVITVIDALGTRSDPCVTGS